MIFEVVYFSRSGNTRKIAEAIALELGVTAWDIKKTSILSPDAFIFLGAGCYGAVVPWPVAEFIKRNRFDGRKTALFTTSAFDSVGERNLIKKKISQYGIEIVDSFSCTGKWLGMNKQHPDRQDIEKAREFAYRVAVSRSPGKYEKVDASIFVR